MGLVDYISRNAYQPAKSISKYDEEFLVAPLPRIHTDAKLLHQEKNNSAVTINKFYHDKSELQKSSTKHEKQVFNINFAIPKLVIRDSMSPAPQSSSSKLPLKHSPNFISDSSTCVRLTDNNSSLATRMYHSNLLPSITNNSDSEHAMRVRLTQNNSLLAKQKPNQTSSHINCTKFDSTLAPRVQSTQNHLALAQNFYTSKLNTLNHNISDCDFDPRVPFTHNRITPFGHNSLLFKQSYISHKSNALFDTHTSNHQIKSKLASHNTNTINTPLRIEPQIALFQKQNTGKASLAYRNRHQFTELSHFNMSITSKPQISSLIGTKKSHTLNNSRAQLVNNKKSLFCPNSIWNSIVFLLYN